MSRCMRTCVAAQSWRTAVYARDVVTSETGPFRLIGALFIPVCGIRIMSICQVTRVDTYVHVHVRMYMKEFSMFVSSMVKTSYLHT